jgi:hypothetical protein
MAIIKLHKVTYKEELLNGYHVRNGYELILFNTDTLITAEPSKQGGTDIRHKAAMVSGFTCKETIDEIEQLIKTEK